jgi:hypothetical protein
MKKLIVLFTRGVLKAAILTTVVSLCLSLSPLEPALAAGGGSKRICSFLGDDPKPSILDQDIFAFNGKKGEKITVTLEVDSSGAHTGKRVNLSLMDEITRTFFFRTTTKKEIGVKEIGVRSTLLTYQ